MKQLLVIQDRDRHIAQLEKELLDLPARKAMIEARLREHEAALHAAEDNLKHKKSDMKQLEVEIEGLKDKIRRFQQQQLEIKSNDQYKALTQEIAEQKRLIGKTEDREIVQMEEAEALRTEVADKQAALKEEQRAVAAEAGAMDARASGLGAELDEARKARAALLAEVPEDVLRRYERILKHKGDFALVPLVKQTCGGCHMILPPQTIQDVKRAQAVHTCTFCGRMLYFA